MKYLNILIAFTIFGFLWWYEQPSKAITLAPNGGITFYANQNRDNLTQVFSETINAAKESVLLLVYSMSDHTIISALNAKANSGVPVDVIMDAKTSPSIESKLSPKVSLLKRYGDGLMHMKVLVVDHRDVLLGSANMTTESLKMHGNLVIGIDSEEFASAIEKKAETLQHGDVVSRMPQKNFSIGKQRVELWFLPDHEKAIHRIQQLLDTAQKTVRVAMFTWTRRDFAMSVIQAKKRGVDVEVVIDYNAGRGAGAPIVQLLKNNRVPVRLSKKGPLLHHKFLYIDGSVLLNGSANWTRAAFRQNTDCFIIIEDLSEGQQKQMDLLWSTIIKDSSAVQ